MGCLALAGAARAILRPRSSILAALPRSLSRRSLGEGDPHPQSSIDSLSSRVALRYLRGGTVYVARPARSILDLQSSILASIRIASPRFLEEALQLALPFLP